MMTSTMSNDHQTPENTFAAQQRLLSERLHFLLASLHPELRADVVSSLEEEGKLLSPHQTGVNALQPVLAAGIWPLLTLLVAEYVSPAIEPVIASSVAVAVECFVRAIDLLDDIIDEDQTPTLQTLGTARTLNVSTALLILAQQAILSLSEQNVPPAQILRLLNTLQESALVTTAGQHLDVLAEQQSLQDFTREECIKIATAKAGSIMRLACRLGALCADANDELCEQFSQLGELLGIAAQLDNDAHDLYYLLQSENPAILATQAETTPKNLKTDLIRGKKTLPVVLAAAAGAGTSLDAPLQRSLELSDEEKQEYLRALHEGILTTWGICLLYRERARDRLQEIEAQRPVTPILKLLLGFS